MSGDLGLFVQAQKSYSKTQNIHNIHTPQVSASNEVHKGFNTQFNKFASMSPQEILNQIQSQNRVNSTSKVSTPLGQMRGAISKHENLVKKSLVNEASSIEILTSSTEAANFVKTLATVRDKFMDAWEKVWTMQV